MRWRYAGTGMVALMMMTGCPSEFGKDGRINKAVRQDTLELVRKKDCDKQTYDEVCGNGRDHTPECIETCG